MDFIKSILSHYVNNQHEHSFESKQYLQLIERIFSINETNVHSQTMGLIKVPNYYSSGYNLPFYDQHAQERAEGSISSPSSTKC